MEDQELDMDVPSPVGSFLNEEASVSMDSLPVEEEEEEDEDLYYIEPRRPSLDLGSSPMESGALLYTEQPKSPAESYLSMRSEGCGSSGDLSELDRSCTRIHLERADSFSTCYTVDSDDCEIRTERKVNDKDVLDVDNTQPELRENLSETPLPHLTIQFVFQAVCRVLQQLRPQGLELFRWQLWQRYPQSFSTSLQTMDIVDIVDRLLECYSPRVVLQVTKSVLQELEQKRLVDLLEDLEIQNEVCFTLRERLKKKYGALECPGGEERPFGEVYTDLHIVSCGNNGPNVEHEVMSIKKDGNKGAKDLCVGEIITEDFVKNDYERIILLSGVAGSGKSMAIRKCVLEWTNQPPNFVNLMFALPVKELKQTFGDSLVSFLDILHHFYPETEKLTTEHYSSNECKIVYVFDGLEEIVEDLDLHNTSCVFDIAKPAKLSVIIASIVKGQLARHGYFLFTARPTPNFRIPYDTRHHKYEVLGFKEEAREEFFRKRFKDPGQAGRVTAYVKSSGTLQIMCHLPLFCSVLSDFWQSAFEQQGPGANPPKGITHMFTRLLLKLLHDQHKDRRTVVDKQQFIMSLGKRALSMLKDGKRSLCVSYPDEVEQVDEVEAATYTGLSTYFFVQPMPFIDEKMFSFIHPTLQEYMAALYTFLMYLNHDKNTFEATSVKRTLKLNINKKSIMDLYKNALEKSLLCEDGNLDIFLRFLFGLSNSNNIELVKQFFSPTVKWTSVAEEAGTLIRKKMSETRHPARVQNLQLCLDEITLNDSESKTFSKR